MPDLSAHDVIRAVEAELRESPDSLGHLSARLHRLRHRLDRFRVEPVGGRLAGVKKIAYWFVASAFDRQGKLLEDVCDLLEDLISEMEALKRVVQAEDSEEPAE